MVTISPAYTQPDTGEPAIWVDEKPDAFAPLEGYFREAIENNPRIREQFYSYRAQVANAGQMGILPDPEVNLGYFINPPEGATFLGRFSFSAMQMFPWPGTLGEQRREGEYMSEAEYHRMRSLAADIFRDVHLTWLDYSEQYLSRAIIRQNIEQIDELHSLIEIRYETARASQADLLRIEMEKERFRTHLEEVDEERLPLQARLNALLNRDLNQEISGAHEMIRRSWTVDDNELLEALKINHPDRDLLNASRQRFRSSVERARLEGRPQIGLGIEVMGRDFSVMSMFPDMNEGVAAMATIRLPIYQQRYREQRREAEYNIQRIEQSNQQLDNRLLADAERYLKDKRDAERRLTLIQDELIPRANQAYEILREEYAVGGVGFEELIQIQRELLDLELEELQTLTEYNRALAQLEWLLSSELSNQPIEF
ncbi:MAG: TolC family protein [Balneolales bacterium]